MGVEWNRVWSTDEYRVAEVTVMPTVLAGVSQNQGFILGSPLFRETTVVGQVIQLTVVMVKNSYCQSFSKHSNQTLLVL